jgi:hypothetical protein
LNESDREFITCGHDGMLNHSRFDANTSKINYSTFHVSCKPLLTCRFLFYLQEKIFFTSGEEGILYILNEMPNSDANKFQTNKVLLPTLRRTIKVSSDCVWNIDIDSSFSLVMIVSADKSQPVLFFSLKDILSAKNKNEEDANGFVCGIIGGVKLCKSGKNLVFNYNYKFKTNISLPQPSSINPNPSDSSSKPTSNLLSSISQTINKDSCSKEDSQGDGESNSLIRDSKDSVNMSVNSSDLSSSSYKSPNLLSSSSKSDVLLKPNTDIPENSAICTFIIYFILFLFLIFLIKWNTGN